MSRYKEVFSVSVSANEYRFLQSYFSCMVWADSPEGANLDPTDLDSTYARQQTIEALAFYHKNEVFFTTESIGLAGHDLWLTRNGHGAGFWDRGNLYVMQDNGCDYADLLSERASAMGESYPEFTQSSLIREGVQNDY